MNPVILRMACDWADVSVGGRVREHPASVLAAFKQLAQAQDHAQYAPLGGLDFSLSPQGSKPFKYVLQGDESSIRLTDSTKIPAASIHLSPLGLALYDAPELYGLVHEIVSDIFGPSDPQKLSRIDVCADFQGVDLAHLNGGKLVCPATFRPIYPNTDHPETYQLGKGQLVVRIYNKSKELRAKGTTTWLVSVWEQHPDYNPTQDVWRFEVQFRREALREFGIDTPHDGFSNLPELLRAGLDWADLRIPNGLSTDRWERHPLWIALDSATGSQFRLTREALAASLATLDRIAASVAGYTISAGATLDTYDLDAVMGILADKVSACIGGPESFAHAARSRRLDRLGKRG